MLCQIVSLFSILPTESTQTWFVHSVALYCVIVLPEQQHSSRWADKPHLTYLVFCGFALLTTYSMAGLGLLSLHSTYLVHYVAKWLLKASALSRHCFVLLRSILHCPAIVLACFESFCIVLPLLCPASDPFTCHLFSPFLSNTRAFHSDYKRMSHRAMYPFPKLLLCIYQDLTPINSAIYAPWLSYVPSST